MTATAIFEHLIATYAVVVAPWLAVRKMRRLRADATAGSQPGASATTTVVFPASAGSPGSAAVERYNGTYAGGGTFGASLRVALPVNK